MEIAKSKSPSLAPVPHNVECSLYMTDRQKWRSSESQQFRYEVGSLFYYITNYKRIYKSLDIDDEKYEDVYCISKQT